MRIGFYSPSLKLKKTATNFDSENTELPENKEKLHKKSAQKVKSGAYYSHTFQNKIIFLKTSFILISSMI